MSNVQLMHNIRTSYIQSMAKKLHANILYHLCTKIHFGIMPHWVKNYSFCSKIIWIKPWSTNINLSAYFQTLNHCFHCILLPLLKWFCLTNYHSIILSQIWNWKIWCNFCIRSLHFTNQFHKIHSAQLYFVLKHLLIYA